MSDRPIDFLRSHQIVPQVGINPDVMASAAVPCVGGPCDGQEMRCPPGDLLLITNAVDGQRATALPPEVLPISKQLGGYGGHYERRENVLHWCAP